MAKKFYYVLIWDFNSDSLKHYDVLPYFRDCFAERKAKSKSKRRQRLLAANPELKKHFGVPATLEEMKVFIENESLYMFWSRCEWEMIIHGWPARKNDYKIDVHEQIMMNIDVLADLLYKELI